jgi:hypothetical protein
MPSGRGYDAAANLVPRKAALRAVHVEGASLVFVCADRTDLLECRRLIGQLIDKVNASGAPLIAAIDARTSAGWTRGTVDTTADAYLYAGQGGRKAMLGRWRVVAVGLLGVLALGAPSAWAQPIHAGTLEWTLAVGGAAACRRMTSIWRP